MTKIQHTPKIVLVTGGAGFIGSNFLHYLLRSDDIVRVINLDVLTYAADVQNVSGLAEAYPQRYRWVQGDISDLVLVEKLFDEEGFDTVIHLAAESHVDRSIDDPLKFVQTNVMGTATLLHAARKAWKGREDVRFHHVSTDEVYGSLGDTGLFTEKTGYDPSSPYSASKAASDHLVRAWQKTYGLPITISNCSNNYGPHQSLDKFLPVMISKALRDQPLPIYGDGQHVRDWLYVEDHCRAIDCIIRRSKTGQTYNVGGNNARTNLEVVYLLCDLLMDMKPKSGGHYKDLISFVADRLGHDRRYAIDMSKIQQELGWQPQEKFTTGLRRTIEWYIKNPLPKIFL
ncbi:MAG: dTDP-glucose 4,6-dehydratase [Candidatus Omnitrophica bacterium]|nr:dTDP-glucose 4,6-dehydratase [Candidatus Omnitrophota bacterium]